MVSSPLLRCASQFSINEIIRVVSRLLDVSSVVMGSLVDEREVEAGEHSTTVNGELVGRDPKMHFSSS